MNEFRQQPAGSPDPAPAPVPPASSGGLANEPVGGVGPVAGTGKREPKIIATTGGAFVAQVFWLVGLMIVAASATGFLTRNIEWAPTTMLILMLGWFGLTFVVMAVKDIPGVNFAAVFGHAALSGVMVAPIIVSYGAEVALQALVVTAPVVFILGFFALVTRYDFTGWGGYLFAGLLALILVQFVGIFLFPGFIASPLFASLGAALFSVLLVFDIQRVRKANPTEGNAIVGALTIYLDILNLFLFILRIFGRR